MAAFNDIIVRDSCPACGKVSELRFQTHVAASFHGDASGRFAHREYYLGQRLAWWPIGHADFATWRTDGEPCQPPNTGIEACYGGCALCAAELFAVVHFLDLVPIEVSAMGLEKNWPSDFQR